jgi:hypothetical protein
MAKPTTKEIDTEMGVQIRGMPFSEVFASGDYVLIRNQEPTVQQLVEMRRNDGQARGLFRLLTMPVRAAARRLTWIPAPGGDKEAKFAEDLLSTPAVSGGMQTSFARVISQMLLAVVDGFAPFELVYTVPRRGPLQGKYALSKIAYRPSETIQFLIGEKGEYNGLRQRTAAPGGRYLDIKIEKDNSLYYACGDEENPFYGVSYFNAAFYHYDKKIKMYYLAHLAAQHRAVGSRLGKYPPGASPNEIAAFKKGLADFGLAQAMSVPDKGYSVEDLGKSLGDFPFMDFINHHNSQMSKSVLAPHMDEQQGGRRPTVDFSTDTEEMHQILINVLISDLETLINEWLIPRFIDWNFGSHNYPSVKFGAFNEDQKKAIITTFDKLAGAGPSANVTRRFLLELERYMAGEMGMDIDYEKVSKALDKQDALSLDHFMQDQAPPPMQRPFQPVGANPADQQQGVPAAQQWLPGPQPVAPAGGPGASSAASSTASGGSPAPTKGKYPALPSQLSVEGIPSASTWLHDDAVMSLSWAEWKTAEDLVGSVS